MRDEKLLPADIERIGVFRALGLGGLLCSTPALRALRAAFPSAYITLIGLPGAQDLVRRTGLYRSAAAFSRFSGLTGERAAAHRRAGVFPQCSEVSLRSGHSAARRWCADQSIVRGHGRASHGRLLSAGRMVP
jgi:hypothetical protein